MPEILESPDINLPLYEATSGSLSLATPKQNAPLVGARGFVMKDPF